jgi:hypothetical protein
MDSTEIQDFIRQCRKIVEVRANSEAFPFGFAGPGVSYGDSEISIACDPESEAMEITVNPGLHPERLHNPVICITKSGEMIRSHGEWKYAKEKVEQLWNLCHDEEIESLLAKAHRQALLNKLGEIWEQTPDKSFMEVLMDYLPEEDIFWTSDEHLALRLDGIDPYDEDE